MKTAILTILLILSLASNILLIVRNGATERRHRLSEQLSQQQTRLKPEALPASKTEISNLAAIVSLFQSDNLEETATELRAANCPPAILRAILAAKVAERFEPQRKALYEKQLKLEEFWRPLRPTKERAEIASAIRDLAREQKNMLNSALGADKIVVSEEMRAAQRNRFGDLPGEKIDRLQALLADYDEIQSSVVYSKANGVILPEDRAYLATIEREKRADLEAMMTREELEEYDLRNSSFSATLRQQLDLFQPSEEEFRALYRLGPISAERPDLLAQAKTVLGDERFKQYERDSDPSYQMVARVMTRLGLPVETASSVLSTQRDIYQRASSIRRDRKLTSQQRESQLSSLAEEATSRLTDTLGGKQGLEAYKQNGGQWLSTIQPRSRKGG